VSDTIEIKVECAIDIDENRRVWIRGGAPECPVEHAGKLGSELVEAVTANACAALGHAVEELGVAVDQDAAKIVAAARASSGAQVPASERPKRPEDPGVHADVR
jgi:hypothetical protein